MLPLTPRLILPLTLRPILLLTLRPILPLTLRPILPLTPRPILPLTPRPILPLLPRLTLLLIRLQPRSSTVRRRLRPVPRASQIQAVAIELPQPFFVRAARVFSELVCSGVMSRWP